MITTTLDYLGHRRAERGHHRQVVQHQVYVTWIGGATDLLAAVLHLVSRGPMVCPECGGAWPLTRDGGVVMKLAELPAGSVRSISTTCPDCPTLMHWDLTPAAQWPRLRWIRLYERRADVMGDRPTRIGARALLGGGA